MIPLSIIIKKYNETWVRLDADPIILQAIADEYTFKPPHMKFHPLVKSGKWDGRVKLYNIGKNLFPYGLLFKLHEWLKRKNIIIEFMDFEKSETMYSEDEINDFAQNLKFPFALRDYQLQCIQTGLSKRKCALLSPTGTGKSAIIYMITRMIRDRFNESNVLIMVPNLSLIQQMSGDFADYSVNIKDYSKECQLIFAGQNKKIEKNVVISTYQSLQHLPKEYFQQFDALLVDECHTGSSVDAKAIKKIVEYCINAKYKIGTTGTIDDGLLNEISINAMYGKIYKFTNTRREIDRGNLSDILIHQIRLKYPEEIIKKFHKDRRQLKAVLMEQGVEIKSQLYQFEIKFLNELNHKKKFIGAICQKQKDNTLILYRRTSFGKALFKQLKEDLKDRQIYMVYGATPKEQREQIRKICEANSNAIIIGSYGCMSTGVNIKRLHNIVFGESCRGLITILQSIGRGLRKHNLKEMLCLFDIGDDFEYKDVKNIVFKHFGIRREIYDREKFVVKDYVVEAEKYG